MIPYFNLRQKRDRFKGDRRKFEAQIYLERIKFQKSNRNCFL